MCLALLVLLRTRIEGILYLILYYDYYDYDYYDYYNYDYYDYYSAYSRKITHLGKFLTEKNVTLTWYHLPNVTVYSFHTLSPILFF
jgi:hypothetical protein